MSQFLANLVRQTNGKKAHLLVFGYIRSEQKLIELAMEFPDDIIVECLKYFFENDKWDKNKYSKRWMKLEGNTIIGIVQRSASAYLMNTISSGIHEWSFLIKKCANRGDGWTQTIGLWKVNADNDPDVDYDFCNLGGIGVKNTGRLTGSGWDSQLYQAKFVTGDIVKMTADFDKGILRFTVNDKDYGKAFQLNCDLEYRAAISLFNEHDAITLL